MVTRQEIVAAIFAPNGVPGVDYRTCESDAGFGLTYWNTAKLGPQPTQAEIDAARVPAARAGRRAAVNAEWSRRKDAGFVWRGKRIDSDPTSRENITNIAAAAMSLLIGGASPTAVIRPAGWKCLDNTYTDPVTLADALNMHGTMITVGAAMFDRAQALKAAIDAAADPEAVDISVGWPE